MTMQKITQHMNDFLGEVSQLLDKHKCELAATLKETVEERMDYIFSADKTNERQHCDVDIGAFVDSSFVADFVPPNVSTKINLCDTCTKEIPTCGSNHVEYGSDKGNDNIIMCSGYAEVIK